MGDNFELLMEWGGVYDSGHAAGSLSNPSCLVWQPGRGRPTRPLSREPNNPYLTEREVRATKSADLPGCKVYSP